MILIAFILGLISSFHCVGMCGPLVMALPVQDLPYPRKIMAILLYHIGRIFTYTALGLLFGLLGRHLFIASYQQWISIGLGALIVVVIFWQKISGANTPFPLGQKISAIVGRWMRYIWGKHSVFSSLFFGLLNGLLPCGMVYYALAGALGTGTLAGSIYFMLFFGIGTLPMMCSIHFLGSSYLTISFRSRIRKLVPLFVGLMGVLLILRGLNLGIPYISPTLANNSSQAIICH